MRTRVVERRALREAGSLEVMVACWKIELVLIEKLLILIFIGLCYLSYQNKKSSDRSVMLGFLQAGFLRNLNRRKDINEERVVHTVGLDLIPKR